jgi:hypothetical protein
MLQKMLDHVEMLINNELPIASWNCAEEIWASLLPLPMTLKLIPRRNKWLEVSSVSNFETFQETGLKLRFKRWAKRKNSFAAYIERLCTCTLRIYAGILENYQSPEANHDSESITNLYRIRQD